MERLKSYGFGEIPEDLAPEDFSNFDDTVAATEPVLFDELIISVVRNSKIEEKVESDEEDEKDGKTKLEVFFILSPSSFVVVVMGPFFSIHFLKSILQKTLVILLIYNILIQID